MCRGPPVRVAEEGLLVVVPSTEAGEVVELRDLRPPERIPMVDLQAAADVAAGDDALGIAHLDGAAKMRRDRLTAVRDSDDVDPLGDEHLQEGVFAEPTGDRHRDRPDPRDLTGLASHGMAPHRRLIVHHDLNHAVRPRHRPGGRPRPRTSRPGWRRPPSRRSAGRPRPSAGPAHPG